MKKILVPTDFSEPSFFGLDSAANIARNSGAEIYIFNVCEVSNYYFTSEPTGFNHPSLIMLEGLNESLEKSASVKMNNLLKRPSLKGLKVNTAVELNSNIHKSITSYSEKIKADIIVIGSNGAGNLKEIILGSTAERVVRFAEIPVIVIPGKSVKGSFKKIVFASDFSKEAYGIFPFIRKFAAINKAEIHLLKINTIDQFSKTIDDKEKIHTFSKKFGGKFITALYNDFMKEEGILNYSREVKADLIAIGTHGKKGLRRFFTEDVSEGIVRLSQIPMLIVNLKEFKNKSDSK